MSVDPTARGTALSRLERSNEEEKNQEEEEEEEKKGRTRHDTASEVLRSNDRLARRTRARCRSTSLCTLRVRTRGPQAGGAGCTFALCPPTLSGRRRRREEEKEEERRRKLTGMRSSCC
ncbi:unnamed protein product [Prorocentrum cordatum]|uniref:Uncharacterized protein n=1 Tax=Prorocentrum cordatum TaxID=2364126 RepID=A0ABN9T7N9_9DINO|nr:unnamed protein product [Polarella glacialis]